MNKVRSIVQIARRALHGSCAAAAILLAGCHSSVPAFVPAPLDQPRQAPGVTMRDVSFYSNALKRQMQYRVYLPAKIAPGQKLPTIYLLHGNGGNFRNWSNYSDVAKYAVASPPGAILVMPEGGSSYWVNAVLKPDDRYGDYLTEDLIADVQARFPAAAGRESRAVVGVSMGGYGAVELALARPNLFVFTGAISPAIDVPSRRLSLKRYWQWERFRNIFGPMDSPTRAAEDPFKMIRNADPSATPYIYLAAGEQEALLEPNQRFAALLKSRHFEYEFHTKPGGHDWNQWDAQIPGCFEALFKHLKQPG